MTVTYVPDERIHQLYGWCSQAFSLAGKRFQFAKNTPPQNTYHWRYLKTLANKIDEYGFDDNSAKLFIETIIKYANKNNLHAKGIAVLFQSNVLEICKKELDVVQQKFDSTLDKLESSISFVNSTDKNFLYKRNPDAKPNIVEWYRNNDIYDVYLAYSKSAYSAVIRLGDVANFPTVNQLYLLRLKLSENTDFLRKSRALLQNDWRGAS